MGSTPSTLSPPPVTVHELIRQRVLSRLPVSYVKTYRSKFSRKRSGAGVQDSNHKTRAFSLKGLRVDEGYVEEDVDGEPESSSPSSCFAVSWKSPQKLQTTTLEEQQSHQPDTPKYHNRTDSDIEFDSFFDYGPSALMWTHRPLHPPINLEHNGTELPQSAHHPAADVSACNDHLTSLNAEPMDRHAEPHNEADHEQSNGVDVNGDDTGEDEMKCMRNDLPKVKNSFYVVKQRVIGNPTNHMPFLEPPVLDILLPYLLGPNLAQVLYVCPHWFVTIYEHLLRRSSPLLDEFRSAMSQYLELVEVSVAIQNLPLKSDIPRIDILLYAKVLPSCVNKIVTLGYSYSYAPPTSAFSHRSSDSGSAAFPQSDAKTNVHVYPRSADGDHRSGREVRETPSGMLSDGQVLFPDESSYSGTRGVHCTAPANHMMLNKHLPYVYDSVFRYVCQRKGTNRELVMHRDITRFHGDEVLVACLPSVATVCAEDIIEIPVVLGNAFGSADIRSVKWFAPSLLPVTSTLRRTISAEVCGVEEKNVEWMNHDRYQATTSERVSACDFFCPEWQHKGTEFTGIDITLSRSKYVAVKTGRVTKSHSILGMVCTVLPKGKATICPLKRYGLQHDRITSQQMRQGDSIVLYLTQGGVVCEQMTDQTRRPYSAYALRPEPTATTAGATMSSASDTIAAASQFQRFAANNKTSKKVVRAGYPSEAGDLPCN